ncbi:hypothetical protein GGI12_000383 [Dipsacomyces acuminosporus]|nr:hypothetical protein GGI12_000383 [Dipsacomyces acuminosporus]
MYRTRRICMLCVLALASLTLVNIIRPCISNFTYAASAVIAGATRTEKPWILAGLGSSIASLGSREQRLARASLDMYLKRAHRIANDEDLHTYCAQDNFSSGFVRSAEKRYTNITKPMPLAGSTSSRLPSDSLRVFVAVNLYNNEHILPNMATQLLAFADLLGSDSVFLSIYENGSKDGTKDILRQFDRALEILRIPHRIVTDEQPRPSRYHRIEYMAKIRNRALEPLGKGGVGFDKVLFLNDVFFCLTDLMELVYQSQLNNAHLTCAEDFELRYGILSFYDTWVSRDILGHAFKGQYQNIAKDVSAMAGQLNNRPFQVQCCWNGMAVIDAQVFQGSNATRFRRSAPGECSASECSLLCNDLWRRGYRRAVVVPRVKVSYDIKTRDQLRAPYNFPRDAEFNDKKHDHVVFRPGPKHVYCHPLDGVGTRSPDGPAHFVPL